MKQLFLLSFLLLALTACTTDYEYEGNTLKTLIEHPSKLVKDPHYAKHKESLDKLESSYLQKEITYAEYMEEKEELENIYNKEVTERNQITNPSSYE